VSARSVLASYAMTHLDRAADAALIGEPRDSSDLIVPIVREADDAGGGSEVATTLICRAPGPSHRRLRHVAALAADLALSAFRPF